MTETVEVWVEIGPETLKAGQLWGHRRGRTESATFRYDSAYIASPAAYPLDPALPLSEGPLQTPGTRPMFAAFSDCAPDRWGRRLIDRYEEQRVRAEGTGAERSLGEADYLLGVRDDLRQGAVRFRRPGDGAWLAPEEGGIPHLIELADLLSASERMERDEATAAELRALLRGGSSLGGARPKAHVIDGDGNFAVAKFPSPSADDWDVMLWEAVTLRLAGLAGVDASSARLERIDGRSVLIVSRFDRARERRIGYVSAMTMLELEDGDQASYLDIAEQIEEQSARPKADLEELWRRITFSVLVSNTDDHLRNHGFLRSASSGWSLSPAFDINPDPSTGTAHLSTSIDGRSTEARLDLALEVADLFRLGTADAQRVLGEVRAATSRWKDVAAQHKAPAREIQRMERAFTRADP